MKLINSINIQVNGNEMLVSFATPKNEISARIRARNLVFGETRKTVTSLIPVKGTNGKNNYAAYNGENVLAWVTFNEVEPPVMVRQVCNNTFAPCDCKAKNLTFHADDCPLRVG